MRTLFALGASCLLAAGTFAACSDDPSPTSGTDAGPGGSGGQGGSVATGGAGGIAGSGGSGGAGGGSVDAGPDAKVDAGPQISGVVIDLFGVGVPGATVSTASGTTTTDAAGKFTISAGSKYTLTVSSPDKKAITIFDGLTRADPTVPLRTRASVTNPTYGTVKGSLFTAAPFKQALAAFRPNNVKTWLGGWAMRSNGTYEITNEWYPTTETATGTLYVWRLTWDSDYSAKSFDGFYEAQVSVGPLGTTVLDFAQADGGTPATSTLNVTGTLPATYKRSQLFALMRPASSKNRVVVNQAVGLTSLAPSFTVPVLSGATYYAHLRGSPDPNNEDAEDVTSRKANAVPGTITLSVPQPPELVTAQNAMSPATLSWTNRAPTSGSYAVHLETGDSATQVWFFTTETSVAAPALAEAKLSGDYKWEILQYPDVATTDSLVDPQDPIDHYCQTDSLNRAECTALKSVRRNVKF